MSMYTYLCIVSSSGWSSGIWVPAAARFEETALFSHLTSLTQLSSKSMCHPLPIEAQLM